MRPSVKATGTGRVAEIDGPGLGRLDDRHPARGAGEGVLACFSHGILEPALIEIVFDGIGDETRHALDVTSNLFTA